MINKTKNKINTRKSLKKRNVYKKSIKGGKLKNKKSTKNKKKSVVREKKPNFKDMLDNLNLSEENYLFN
tara:strand:+ start:211 stop:417 length:207 start_codon:yes stop_codon:yes gene_type:complete